MNWSGEEGDGFRAEGWCLLENCRVQIEGIKIGLSGKAIHQWHRLAISA